MKNQLLILLIAPILMFGSINMVTKTVINTLDTNINLMAGDEDMDIILG